MPPAVLPRSKTPLSEREILAAMETITRYGQPEQVNRGGGGRFVAYGASDGGASNDERKRRLRAEGELEIARATAAAKKPAAKKASAAKPAKTDAQKAAEKAAAESQRAAKAEVKAREVRSSSMKHLAQSLEDQAAFLNRDHPDLADQLRQVSNQVRALMADPTKENMEAATDLVRESRRDVKLAVRDRVDQRRAEAKAAKESEAAAKKQERAEAKAKLDEARRVKKEQADEQRKAKQAETLAHQTTSRKGQITALATSAEHLLNSIKAGTGVKGAKDKAAENDLQGLVNAIRGLTANPTPENVTVARELLGEAKARSDTSRTVIGAAVRTQEADAKAALKNVQDAQKAKAANQRKTQREAERVTVQQQMDRVDSQIRSLKDHMGSLSGKALDAARRQLDALENRRDSVRLRVSRLSTDIAASADGSGDAALVDRMQAEGEEILGEIDSLADAVDDALAEIIDLHLEESMGVVSALVGAGESPTVPEGEQPDSPTSEETPAEDVPGEMDAPASDEQESDDKDEDESESESGESLGASPAVLEQVRELVDRLIPESQPVVASSASSAVPTESDLLFDAPTGSVGRVAVLEKHGLVWKPIARVGRWPGGLMGQPLEITRDMLLNVKQAFDAQVVEFVDVPDGHYRERFGDNPVANHGYVRSLLFGNNEHPYWDGAEGDFLWGGFLFTEPDTLRKIRNGSIANVSGWFKPNFEDWRTKKKWPWVLWHVALTNKPIVTGLRTFAQAGAVLSWGETRPGMAIAESVDQDPEESGAPEQEETVRTRTAPAPQAPGAPEEPAAPPAERDDDQVVLSRSEVEALRAAAQMARDSRDRLHRAEVRSMIAAMQGRGEHDDVALPDGVGLAPVVCAAIEPFLLADAGHLPTDLVLSQDGGEWRPSVTEVLLTIVRAIGEAGVDAVVSTLPNGRLTTETPEPVLSGSDLPQRVSTRLGAGAGETDEQRAARVDAFLEQEGLLPPAARRIRGLSAVTEE